MAGIVFDNVGKVYPGGTRALAEVDLEVGDGEFVVLVGPSGCGKSTLLRMVAGLEEITDGTISIDGNIVNDVPPKDRDIAMVFQNYALYPHMTVFDNMAFGLKLRKMPKDQIKAAVEEAARVLEITEYLDRKPKALSGGQRQRVAMGRAIVRQPAAFLMDEPLSNLDAKLRVQMRSELGLLHARLGTTTLYVTHDQVEAMTMGDRVAVLRQYSGSGTNLQQADTPRTLYDDPNNLFVAGFIGSPSMNFVNARIEGDGDGAKVVFGEESLVLDPALLSAKKSLGEYSGKELILGLRPEVFEMVSAAKGLPTEGRTISVNAELTEQLGSEAFVHFSRPIPPVITQDIEELLEDEGGTAAMGSETKFTARVNPDVAPTTGQQADLVVDTTKLHFFDRDTGLAIR